MANIEKGEKVRWYIGAMGTEVDLHTAHWHGNIIKKDNAVYEDVVQLMPAFTTTVDMFADNPGTWFYHCHVNDHVEAGMIATYTVLNKSCTDCVGMSDDMTESDDNIVGGAVDVLLDTDTWIIIAVSFMINMIGFVCVWFIFIGRNRSSRKKSSYGTIQNNQLKTPMLSDLPMESLSKKTHDDV